MKVWYNSQKRFNKRIIKQWEERGFKYHAGHINILTYAYRISSFWEIVNQKKVSQINQLVGYPKLF